MCVMTSGIVRMARKNDIVVGYRFNSVYNITLGFDGLLLQILQYNSTSRAFRYQTVLLSRWLQTNTKVHIFGSQYVCRHTTVYLVTYLRPPPPRRRRNNQGEKSPGKKQISVQIKSLSWCRGERTLARTYPSTRSKRAG